MEFKDYSIDKFIEELSSSMPSPGGGSTAALVAALATSLNSMVYSITIGKKAFERLNSEEKARMILMSEESKELTDKLQKFMEQDRKDFLNLMDSFKLKKETEKQKEIRKDAIKENTIKAMKTPLLLGEEALKYYSNIEFAIKYGNKNLISDAGVAAILLNASIESAILNVKINLNSLREDEEYNNVLDRCNNILMKSEKIKNLLLKEVNNAIYPE
ncbi:cyclodeaminase/cyclohydrolase family protein [Clostridium sp.]|uniref:cyclodeaminase/cyclohydrolase family protein n=1 Tax=Clostridium sp. TaxID=1506 RepID=UPI00262342CD|nr:cyclodeaminase/cyclohydrolase family protein [Clostridium sp.]